LLVVAGFLAAVLAETRPVRADADDAAVAKSAAQSDNYSTGKAGGRLKWIAQRPAPAKQKSEAAVTPTQYVEPLPTEEPSCEVQPVQNLQPSTRSWTKSLDDKKPALTPAPVEKLGDVTPPKANGKKAAKSSSPLENELISKTYSLNQNCPSPKDLKRISELGTDIDPPPPPPSWTEDKRGVPRDCPLGNEVFQPRAFSPITYTWTASQLCHKPLYFEDEQLERYGHMCGPWLQPFASAANFFLTFPILPYKMGLELPNECIYTLGYYRTGDCAPYLFDPLPISVRGMFFEGTGWVAGCAMFP
jgi:hypothetical protein